MLGAASLATIKRTHGRYFGGDYEVLSSVESRSVEAKDFADALTAP